MAAPAPSTPTPTTGSAYLAIDRGAAFTKAFVLDDVEGERRLVAMARVPSVSDDGSRADGAATDEAVARAMFAAGRGSEHLALQAVLASDTGIVRVLVAGARDEAMREAVALLERHPVRLLEPVLLSGGAAAGEQLLAAVEAQQPDVVILATGERRASGSEGRALLAALEALRFGTEQMLVLEESPPGPQGGGAEPPVDEGAIGDSGATPDSEADTVETAPYVTPEPVVLGGLESVAADPDVLEGVTAIAAGDAAALAAALDRVALERGRRRALYAAGGPPDAPAGAAAFPSSPLAGISAATELVASRYDVDVLTLDLGAAHALAVMALNEGGRRRVVTVARDDLGLRLGRANVLRSAGAEAVARWLPVDAGLDLLRADADRALAAPAALPESLDDLLLEHAYAREALRLLLGEVRAALRSGQAPLPQVDLLIGSGGPLGTAPRLMQAVMILLDAVQPEALTQLALDRAAALPLLGHLAGTLGHSAVGAALERDGLLNLGLCIAPIGQGREGDMALRVEVAYATRSPVTVEVPFGALEVVPLAPGERASLKLWPSRDFDVGLGRGNAATPRAEVEGGAVGIVIDARGRPFSLPSGAEKRQAKLLQWLQSTHAYPQPSFVQGGDR